MFVDTFIRRPILASVCSLVLILAGAIAIPTLPIAQFPELSPPQVQVIAFYNGANAQTVETGVTIPLEQAINGVEGMQYMTSTSGNDGTCAITITFEVSRNLDVAAVDVQNRISQAEGRLPNEVKQVGISVAKVSTNFVLAAAAYAEHGEYDPLFISNYVDRFVIDELKRVPGVGNVIVFGVGRYAMRLWLDPDRLAGRNITAGEVVQALREQNVQVAAGAVGQQPARPGQTFQISVRAAGRLTDPVEFDNVILKRATDGALVRVKDVARTELGAESYGTASRYQARDAVGIGVLQLPTANSLQVFRDVSAEIDRLSRRFPPGMKVDVAFETTSVVSESIREVVTTLAQAIALVVLVMFLFLQNWRTTLIPAITIPVALIGTFAFVKLFGFSINTLTLFGITLATGLVVDDAIVVIENIERHIHDYHRPASEAASTAMSEVTGAVIATALVLAAVFVPVAFFPGTTGRLYQQFALTIAVSMAISAFCALTLTPALAALLLAKAEKPKGAFFRGVNRVIDGGTASLVRALRRLVRARAIVTLLFLLLLAATYWVYTRVPTGFVPDEDQGYVMILIQAPQGASLEYTMNVVRQTERIMQRLPESERMFAAGGFSFAGSAPNQGIVFVQLKDFPERRRPEQSARAIVGRLYGEFSAITGAMVLPFLPPSIPSLAVFGGFTYELLDQSGGPIENLAAAAQQIIGQGNATPGLTALFTQFTANDPQLVVDIDREQAKSVGMSLGDITETMQVLLGSSYVNDFDFNNRSYRVYVQADQQFRSTPSDIERYYVRTSAGSMMPLSNVVSVRESTAPQSINHFNLFRSAEINGSAAPGFSSGQALAVMQQLSDRALPQGFSYAWSGLSLEEVKAGGQSAIIFGLGLLLVYLTLAAQYESVTLPFIILLSVPLAILGALGAQWARGLIDDVYCQIGLVMLIGLSAKNGILVVEFAEQLRARGLTIAEAAVEAARIRLRPILMTSLAFILGVMPLVVASGAGREARHSVGTAVAGGMIASTFLNLAFIPVLYVVVKSLGRRRS
ncbi:MAG: hydrophobe/amphiphile efflux-1 family RND transporter [Acidobacteria bacterium]|nr:MAG: hydrophobe/amphiphile efflux-1 family RND transporter [Acidobacteriota bacterium]PYQ89556.1 MAG: hydrophobe/amphiphile efflux-1 family RND transporter [Acidobacteriota bacterium]PYR05163.1 MAG: hydrophobe/amphiphile efflux-1 family RND transporter [Acidobacteriota bacterium]